VGYRIVSRLIGLLLLAAAGLKLQGLAVDPVARVGLFSAAWVQVAVIEFELALGIWLLTGARPAAARLVTLLTFTIFAGVSCYAGVVGRASCGCFGKVPLSPWYAFAADVAVVVALLLTRPRRWEVLPAPRASLRPALLGIVAVAVLVLTTAGVSVAFGSMDAALARLRGETVSIAPADVDVGAGGAGEVKEAVVEVRNWADRPIRVVGGTADCSCVTLQDLPVEVPPGEARSITISVRLPGAPGLFMRLAFLRIDDGRMRPVPFRIAGRARE
jgi:hypothetical protein